MKRVLRGLAEWSVIAGLISIALCFGIIFTNRENVVITWIVIPSCGLIVLTLVALFAGLFGRMDREAREKG